MAAAGEEANLQGKEAAGLLWCCSRDATLTPVGQPLPPSRSWELEHLSAFRLENPRPIFAEAVCALDKRQ